MSRFSDDTITAVALVGTVCWGGAVWLAWGVSARLGIAAILGSVAVDLSEWLRDYRLREAAKL